MSGHFDLTDKERAIIEPLNRWRKTGVWERILNHLQEDIEDERYMTESTLYC